MILRVTFLVNLDFAITIYLLATIYSNDDIDMMFQLAIAIPYIAIILQNIAIWGYTI